MDLEISRSNHISANFPVRFVTGRSTYILLLGISEGSCDLLLPLGWNHFFGAIFEYIEHGMLANVALQD